MTHLTRGHGSGQSETAASQISLTPRDLELGLTEADIEWMGRLRGRLLAPTVQAAVYGVPEIDVDSITPTERDRELGLTAADIAWMRQRDLRGQPDLPAEQQRLGGV